VPIGDSCLTINRNDHFDFMKLLKFYEHPKQLSQRHYISIEEHDRRERNIQDVGKLNYYGVSEYGDLNDRPHWHYLLFNIRDVNSITAAWEGKGKIDIDPDVNVNNIDYVLKYMVKPQFNLNEIKQKECAFWSYGIGSTAANAEFIDYIRKDCNNTILSVRGTKLAIPRYYKRKYLTDEERKSKADYVAKEIEAINDRKEKSTIRRGLNPDAEKVHGKSARYNALVAKTNRDLK